MCVGNSNRAQWCWRWQRRTGLGQARWHGRRSFRCGPLWHEGRSGRSAYSWRIGRRSAAQCQPCWREKGITRMWHCIISLNMMHHTILLLFHHFSSSSWTCSIQDSWNLVPSVEPTCISSFFSEFLLLRLKSEFWVSIVLVDVSSAECTARFTKTSGIWLGRLYYYFLFLAGNQLFWFWTTRFLVEMHRMVQNKLHEP